LRREHQLLLACARVELTTGRREQLAALLQTEVDWAFVYTEARHHHLVPLLHYHLSSIPRRACPTPIFNRIRAAAKRTAANSVVQTSELFGLVAAFDEAGIPVLTLKGPVAANSLYGDVSLRASADLDLLVRQSDAEPAIELLNRVGFEPDLSLPVPWRKVYLQTNYELTFLPKERHCSVDLHWRLIPPGYSFSSDTDELWKRATTIRLRSNLFRTLGPEDSLAFYCLHAAKHGWSVLSYLVDITQLVERNSGLDWEFVTSNAIASGAKGFMGVSLCLARTLLEADIPDDVVTQLSDEPYIDGLIERVTRNLLPSGARSTSSMAWPWPWRHWYFQAMGRTRDRAQYLFDMLLRPTPLEWRLLKLPVALAPLYYPLRPLRLLARQLVRLTRPINPASGWNQSLDR
jgi:hypothetical protein